MVGVGRWLSAERRDVDVSRHSEVEEKLQDECKSEILKTKLEVRCPSRAVVAQPAA